MEEIHGRNKDKDMDIHVHIHHSGLEGIKAKLNKLITLNRKIMSKVTDLELKVDEQTTKIEGLQSSLDAEQEQIKGAIESLTNLNNEQTTLIQQLRDELAELGADTETIDRIAGKLTASNEKLDAIKSDLEGTIADQAEE